MRFDLDTLCETAARYNIPSVDALMIALNHFGSSSDTPRPRARMQLRPQGSEEVWQTILPLDNPGSPFGLTNGEIRLSGETVAWVESIENDDVVLYYPRAAGRNVTLNTYSRSSCVGCVFCPNVIEDAADQLLGGQRGLDDLFSWIAADLGEADLSGVESLTVCTGCFKTPERAIRHLSDIKDVATGHGFSGRMHLLSSVIRDRADLERAIQVLLEFHLTLTIECFDRRALLLKDSKASLSLDKAVSILSDCRELGIVGDFTYVTGLDERRSAIDGLKRLCERSTAFPRIQVYQAHNEYMRFYQSNDMRGLDYFFEIRNAIEASLQEAKLQPRSWENYRPLWYTNFGGLAVQGPRI